MLQLQTASHIAAVMLLAGPSRCLLRHQEHPQMGLSADHNRICVVQSSDITGCYRLG